MKSESQEEMVLRIKKEVELKAWMALNDYFDKKGNGPAAKIAVVVVGTIAKEAQTRNGERQLNLIEQRLLIKQPALLNN